MLEHFPMLETCRGVPYTTIKGIELTTGTGITQSHMHMVALSRMISCGYLKKWIEGGIDEPETMDIFEAEYSLV